MRADHHQPLEELRADLRERLDRLPRTSGVYLLKDKQDTIVYVGKAKNIYARVRTYFIRSGDQRAFVSRLATILGDIDTIVTETEKEALLLENTLIKEHKPRFNVLLRDDKAFLVLRLDPRADFPRLEVVRRINADGARYFGPYHSAASCRAALRVINRYFHLRTCTDATMKSRTRACLQYQIGRCPAPCVFEIDRSEYAQQVADVISFLRGQKSTLIADLEGRMSAASDALNFEVAARLRDQIVAIRSTLERQDVVHVDGISRDVFSCFREGSAVELTVLNFRDGRLIGRQSYPLSGQDFEMPAAIIGDFISRYYEMGYPVPDEILVPFLLEDLKAKIQWLSEKGDGARQIQIIVPQRGTKRKLVQLATRNARASFVSRRNHSFDAEGALANVQRHLGLRRLPRRIECYDVSSLMGEHVVASMVVMQDAQPDPACYRRFKVNVAGPGKAFSGDDFSSLYQVVSRRLRRARENVEGWGLPDLMVVDGGKGQLSMVRAAVDAAGLSSEKNAPEVVALAKERRGPDRKGNLRPDRVFLSGADTPILLRSDTSSLSLLSRLRDEAHRFAITYHRKVRHRATFHSVLDDIPGIGPKRSRSLRRSFGSLTKIRSASVAELENVPGITKRAAENIAVYFAGREDGLGDGKGPKA